MSGASIRIDQAANSVPTGTASRARDDIWQGQTVSLVSAAESPPNSSWLWTMLDRPTGSTAILSNSTTNNASFTPDVAGTYRIELDAGGATQIRIVGVTKNSAGVSIRRGWRYPALAEALLDPAESNVSGVARGWLPALEKVFNDVDQGLAHAQPVVTVGAVGSGANYLTDGVNDETEINQAITDMNTAGGGIVQLMAGTFFIANPVTLTGKSNVHLRGMGDATSIVTATGYANTNYFAVGGYGVETTNTAIVLSSNGTYGDSTIATTPSAELNAVTADSYLFLATDALVTPEQNPQSGRMFGEYVRVKSVNTGTGVITIYGMLRGQYNTADNAKLYRMSFLSHVRISDFQIFQQEALGVRASAPVMVGLQKSINSFIERVHVHKSDGPGLSLHSNIGCAIRDCYIHDLTDNTGSNQFGYGILLSGANENCIIENNRATRVRHMVTTGSISTPSPSNIILRGVSRACLIQGNVGSHCTDTIFDSHAEAENFSFIGNLAQNGLALGFFTRARSSRIIANTVEWCASGIQVGSNIFDGSSGQAAGTQVVGNVLRHLKNAGGFTSTAGIALCLTDHCLVKGNSVTACDGAGIWMRFSANSNIIEDNTLTDCNLKNNSTNLADAISIDGGISGTTATLTFSGGVITATGLSGMGISNVGQKIVVSGAATSANNGSFVIASFISATSVTWANASGATDANNGAISWYVEWCADNQFLRNTAKNNVASLTEKDDVGHAKYGLRMFASAGGVSTSRRNVIKNNQFIGMETGMSLLTAGNFEAGTSSNEATPVKQGSTTPLDTDFSTTPLPGTLAVDATLGLLYFRSATATVWGDILHGKSGVIAVRQANIQFGGTVAAPTINQGSTASGNGQAMSLSAQNTSDGAGTGGGLFLSAGSGGAANGTLRFCPIPGTTGVLLNASASGQSNYQVVSGATSVLFNHVTIATNGATAGNWTFQAQNASGTTSTGGDIIHSSGSGTSVNGKVRLQVAGVDAFIVDGTGWPALQGLRLTARTTEPVPTTDTSNVTTIIFTPFTSGSISLYNGTSWIKRETGEISIALGTLTSTKNYDIFAFWTGTAVQLEFSQAWTSDTARTDAIVLLNGVWVKSGTPTRRYVGTFRTTSTTQTQDTQSQRYIWNRDNWINRLLYVQDTTASWTYNSATFRQVRAQTTNKFEVVCGLPVQMMAEAYLLAEGEPAGTGVTMVPGIGIDSTSSSSSQAMCTIQNALVQQWNSGQAIMDAVLGIGYHALNWLESGNTGTVTAYGALNTIQSHMRARIPM